MVIRSPALPFAALIAFGAGLACAPARAGQIGLAFDQGRGIRECSALRVRLDDPAGQPRVIRSAPDELAPPVGEVWMDRSAGDDRSFDVSQTFNGWLLVGAASHEGWISCRGVSTGVAATLGYSHPTSDSQIVLRSTDGSRIDAHAELIDIIACDGAWVFGRWRIDAPERVDYRNEIEIWTEPVVVEIWTIFCDRRAPDCDTPDREGSRRVTTRNPFSTIPGAEP